MAFKYKDSAIARRMPQLGDIVIKDRGEVKDKFVIVEEHEYFFLGVAQRLKYKECFTKASFALREFKIQKKDGGV
ncbi:hypothetical protein [Clostridium guangxiense]|uniref:hypothetical protein n=1 Tax=Clostridium guangxiense TaxID=1662055 RepID=UPI001E543DB1|nr:hypothetical protein [Clostridium guangxiense]MCD2347561.1 hypothetical protein [Clostridium guangxiense]